MADAPVPGVHPVERRRILPPYSLGSLEDYADIGGGRGLEAARSMGPERTIEFVVRSGLRGRGGAGFPTGAKWGSVARAGGARHYAVCNAAEGEPGTFKDRALLRANPYAVLEGLLIAAEAVGASETYLALKASFAPETEAVSRALVEIEKAGWLGDLTVSLVAGPEEYLFGEEKALLEVIEGNDPLPRWLPPYVHGLFATAPQLGWEASVPGSDGAAGLEANPTLVNNAETLAHTAWILAHGAGEFRELGTESSAGTLICTVVGDVRRSGVLEVPMGTPLQSVLDACGGAHPGREVRAVFSGVSNAVLSAADLDTPLTHEAMTAAGSGLGSAGFVVYDDTACMVEVASTLSRFLHVESCGQCPPCKLGTGAITAALDTIRDGSGSNRDLDRIEESLRIVTDGNRCYLPVEELSLVSSVLRTFPGDFAAHIDGSCPVGGRKIPPPKILDIADGIATYDPNQERKRPDWTYSE